MISIYQQINMISIYQQISMISIYRQISTISIYQQINGLNLINRSTFGYADKHIRVILPSHSKNMQVLVKIAILKSLSFFILE